MKRILSYCLAVTMVLALLVMPTVMPRASALTDLSGDLVDKVPVLQMLGVVSGYPDGTFKAGKSLTRAEFCKMVIALLGEEDKTANYKNFTRFGDVKSTHWAVGEINLAVSELGLIKGMPDGSFRPDNAIKYSEAVAILVRALGYSDADVGLIWPDGYMNKAASLKLTQGITGSANAAIGRGDGARLFYNMLSAKTKDGQSFISTVAASVREGVVILESSATAADGSTGAVLVAGDASAIKSKRPMPSSFEGLRGTLILDENGVIISFIPAASNKKSIILSDSTYPKITGTGGETYTLKSSTVVYMGGVQKTFLEVSYDLIPGSVIEILFTDAGTVDYIIVRESGLSDTAVILNSTPSVASLESMLGASSGGRILKNNTLSSASDLKKYDVVTYNASSNIYTVSDFRLTGAYEFAYPNTTSPTKLTLLGTEFDVMPQAIPSLQAFKVGEIITLLFTADMRVAGAVSNATLSARAIGLYTGTNVQLVGGPTLSITSTDVAAGTLVRVYSTKANTPTLSEILDNNPNMSLDMNKNTIGTKEISNSAVFYEKVGSKGIPVRIDKKDITMSQVPADKVLFAAYDSSDRANVIVLDDVTGDRYEYGKFGFETKTDTVPFGDGTVDISVSYTWVVNSLGKSEEHETTLHQIPKNSWGGLAYDRTGRAIKFVELIKYTGMTRQSFKDNNSILVGGVYTDISNGVHVYLNATGSYLNSAKYDTLEELIIDARAFGTSFEVYTDRAPSDGGSVRIIIVK